MYGWDLMTFNDGELTLYQYLHAFPTTIKRFFPVAEDRPK
jgi:hypothetical protein